ncbi:hypothetical protein ANPL_04375 [Anaplasma platys]|uniref:Uncharacterized protein n=1 Tax=Anaplasma platys TaxID=949 RepID=A0A858PZE6_9RICK|nr:hypothetical protein ANPL_04375 [Anaplasma platys]
MYTETGIVSQEGGFCDKHHAFCLCGPCVDSLQSIVRGCDMLMTARFVPNSPYIRFLFIIWYKI